MRTGLPRKSVNCAAQRASRDAGVSGWTRAQPNHAPRASATKPASAKGKFLLDRIIQQVPWVSVRERFARPRPCMLALLTSPSHTRFALLAGEEALPFLLKPENPLFDLCEIFFERAHRDDSLSRCRVNAFTPSRRRTSGASRVHGRRGPWLRRPGSRFPAARPRARPHPSGGRPAQSQNRPGAA